jgi:hypothetical protein
MAAQAMRQRLLDGGFPSADLVLAGPTDRKQNLIARFRGSGKARPVVILCHLDVVEAQPPEWTTDPFRFIEKDGYFYGRGTQDIKDNDRCPGYPWLPAAYLLVALGLATSTLLSRPGQSLTGLCLALLGLPLYLGFGRRSRLLRELALTPSAVGPGTGYPGDHD